MLVSLREPRAFSVVYRRPSPVPAYGLPGSLLGSGRGSKP